ncbi:MAG: hypothetical protein EXR29_03120 [Betaproteobacteria bacterium]|nr:hypothetical protein [Betaproteobacteria bacterium]
MAKSVRISDPLFEHATLESTLMHRSIAMQIEHWCALGRALAASGMSVAELKAVLRGTHIKTRAPSAKALAPRTRAQAPRTVPEARMWAEKRQRQRRDRAAVASGAATPESMHLIPPRLARKTIGRFKDVSFDD